MFVLVLVEAVERVVVQLPTNIAVAVQLLTVGVGRLEAVLVSVVHQLSRWSSTYCFSTSSDTCPVEMRQYESFQNESPHSSQFGLQFILVLVADAAGGRALDRVDELHEVGGRFRSEQDVNVVVLSVEVRQFDAVLVREPADDPTNELGSLLS